MQNMKHICHADKAVFILLHIYKLWRIFYDTRQYEPEYSGLNCFVSQKISPESAESYLFHKGGSNETRVAEATDLARSVWDYCISYRAFCSKPDFYSRLHCGRGDCGSVAVSTARFPPSKNPAQVNL